MDFDWIDVPFDLSELPPKNIEESFEDPFALKFLPDGENSSCHSDWYSRAGGVFAVFWTDGKKYRIIFARPMTPEEDHFYERKRSAEL